MPSAVFVQALGPQNIRLPHPFNGFNRRLCPFVWPVVTGHSLRQLRSPPKARSPPATHFVLSAANFNVRRTRALAGALTPRSLRTHQTDRPPPATACSRVMCTRWRQDNVCFVLYSFPERKKNFIDGHKNHDQRKVLTLNYIKYQITWVIFKYIFMNDNILLQYCSCIQFIFLLPLNSTRLLGYYDSEYPKHQ